MSPLNVLLFAGAGLAISGVATANFLFAKILGEVNGRVAPADRFSQIGASWKSFVVLRWHRQLFPHSRLRLRMECSGLVGLALGILTAVVAVPSQNP